MVSSVSTLRLFLSLDDAFPKLMVLPVPVPVYVPVPMNMYSQCTPRPVGLPLPVCGKTEKQLLHLNLDSFDNYFILLDHLNIIKLFLTSMALVFKIHFCRCLQLYYSLKRKMLRPEHTCSSHQRLVN